MKKITALLAAGTAIAALATAGVSAQEAFRIDTQTNDMLKAAAAAELPNPGAGGTPGAAPPAATISDNYGEYITVAGMAVYIFNADDDDPTTVTCYGECATEWPPVLVTAGAMPEIGFEAAATQIGTVTRTDGTVQLTYDGWPLYYYAGDNDTADINGQLENEFGAQWRLIDADGEPIDTDPEMTMPTPPTGPAGGTPPPAPPAP